MRKTPTQARKPRGFAAISLKRRREIARMGGNAVSKGPKGRKHMAEIGRDGGQTMHKTHQLTKRR